MGCRALFGSHKAKPFIGRRLDGNLVRRDVENAGNVDEHVGNVRGDLRTFKNDGRINIDDGEAMLLKQIADVPQEKHTGNPLVSRIRVREVLSDISKAGRPEQGIHDGMEENIGVRMAVEPLRVGNIHAAEGELPSFYQTVNVVSETNSWVNGATLFQSDEMIGDISGGPSIQSSYPLPVPPVGRP